MELLIAFGVNVLTSFIKGWVKPKFGNLGVHAVVFVLAVAGVFGWEYISAVPAWKEVALSALETLAYAVAIYEVILKRIGFFKGDVVA